MSKGFMISLGVIAVGIAYLLHPAITSGPAVPREKTEIRALKQALDQFRAVYSYYPTGELDAVVAVLSGENPRKMIFLDWFRALGDRDNKAVDPWGTPYRIRVTATGVTGMPPNLGHAALPTVRHEERRAPLRWRHRVANGVATHFLRTTGLSWGALGVTVTCAGRDKKFGTADDRSTD